MCQEELNKWLVPHAKKIALIYEKKSKECWADSNRSFDSQPRGKKKGKHTSSVWCLQILIFSLSASGWKRYWVWGMCTSAVWYQKWSAESSAHTSWKVLTFSKVESIGTHGHNETKSLWGWAEVTWWQIPSIYTLAVDYLVLQLLLLFIFSTSYIEDTSCGH